LAKGSVYKKIRKIILTYKNFFSGKECNKEGTSLKVHSPWRSLLRCRHKTQKILTLAPWQSEQQLQTNVFVVVLPKGPPNTQYNDTRHNNIQHNYIQHNDIQHNDIQPNYS
jgi:hypothetical protein